MIGRTISRYKITENICEGELVRRSLYINLEISNDW